MQKEADRYIYLLNVFLNEIALMHGAGFSFHTDSIFLFNASTVFTLSRVLYSIKIKVIAAWLNEN
jgi:hypothetical protein